MRTEGHFLWAWKMLSDRAANGRRPCGSCHGSSSRESPRSAPQSGADFGGPGLGCIHNRIIEADGLMSLPRSATVILL